MGAKRPEVVVKIAASGDTLRMNETLRLTSEGVKERLLNNKSEQAKGLLRRAIALDPSYPPANYEYANILVESAPDSALLYAKKAYDSDTLNKWYAELYARTLISINRLEDASKIYTKLIKLTPSNINNYRVKALLENFCRRPQSAIAMIDSAELRFGRISELSLLKNELYISTSQSDKAIQEYLDIKEKEPYDTENRLLLANTYLTLKRDSIAHRELIEAHNIEPNSLPIQLALALYYNKRNNMISYASIVDKILRNGAYPVKDKIKLMHEIVADKRLHGASAVLIDNLSRSLWEEYPLNPEVVTLRANILYAMDKREEGINLYKERTRDQAPDIEYFKAVIYAENERQHRDSVDHYMNIAKELFPNDMELTRLDGDIKQLRGNYEESRECYHKALSLTESPEKLSSIWETIGNLENLRAIQSKANHDLVKLYLAQCYAAYQEALKHNPDNAMVLNNYAYSLSEESGGDLALALKMSKRSIELQGKNTTFLDTYAWILYKLGRYEDAKEYMLQAISLDDGQNYEIPLHYGDILAALGNDFMAEVYWRKAEKLGFPKEEVELRIKRLKGGEK